jgi:hypothetical protein
MGGSSWAKVAGGTDLDRLCVWTAQVSLAAESWLGGVCGTVESWQTRNRYIGRRAEVSNHQSEGSYGGVSGMKVAKRKHTMVGDYKILIYPGSHCQIRPEAESSPLRGVPATGHPGKSTYGIVIVQHCVSTLF